MASFPKTQFYRYVFSFLFGSLVLLIFYGLRWTIPRDIPIYNEVINLVFVAVAILVLFPVRKKILSYFFHMNDYASLVSGDYSDLNFSTRPFVMETLLHKEFPEFLDWLGISSGALAVLDPARSLYKFYYYYNRKQIRQRNLNRKSHERLCRFLAENSSDNGISISENTLPDDIRQYMKELHAYSIYPLLYRKMVMGFLVFDRPLHKSHNQHILQTFRHKAALCVQNYILSHRVIDSRNYDQEFQMAQKIYGTLQSSKTPEIPHYKIEWSKSTLGLISQFFFTKQENWLFMALMSTRFTGSIGILLYGIIGQLYSLIHMKQHFSLAQLAKEIMTTHDLRQTDIPIHILLLELSPKNAKFNFFVTTKEDFSISKQDEISSNEKIVLPVKGVINLNNKTALQVSCRQETLLHLFYDEAGEI